MTSRTLAGTLIALATWVTACADPAPDRGATVFLVHGLGRTAASMVVLGRSLENAGYDVVNFGYPSRSEPIDSLAGRLAEAVGACCDSADEPVHFVTHSMGGIIVRAYFEEHPDAARGRVVMLAPPNQGSEVIDAFADSPLLRTLLGPSALQLGTDSSAIGSELGPVDFSLGIITGDRSLNPINSILIPGPDDGKVAVSNAWVEGAEDFLVLDATHTFIMNRADVAGQVISFLEGGRFLRPTEAP